MELLERPNQIWFFVGIAAKDFHGFPNTTDGLPEAELSTMDAEIQDRLSWVREGESITPGPGVDQNLGILTVNDEIVGWGIRSIEVKQSCSPRVRSSASASDQSTISLTSAPAAKTFGPP